MKKLFALIISLAMILSLAACGADTNTVASTTVTSSADVSTEYPDAHYIVLSDTSASLDDTAISEFDYTWHIDPSQESEWYEGTEPETDAAAYIAHDIWYYPELDEDGFTAEVYDDETEWVYHYTAEGLTDYIFSTLPYFQGDNSLPTDMMFSEETAYENKVLHITQPGTYVLSGSWHGQIFVDLGDSDETFADENAKVTIVLNDVDVSCDCAPAIIFYSAYECDNTWEDQESWSNDVDTTNAGANVIIADGTENNFTGANVYRLLKAKYKNDETTVQKKAHKTDGAFYSFVSMNINGEEKGTGILNITSTTFEGLDTELHLTINGGYINLYTQDDGINVNEDDVSVFTMNGGTLHIFAGLGREGDCVDSNGYIVVNGGIIAAGTPSGSDEVLDSNNGNTINGGQVIEVGSGQGMGGMGPGNMGDFDPSKMGDFDPGENGENGAQPPQMPDGQQGQNGQGPQMPGGQDSQQNGGQPPQMPGGQQSQNEQ